MFRSLSNIFWKFRRNSGEIPHRLMNQNLQGLKGMSYTLGLLDYNMHSENCIEPLFTMALTRNDIYL